MSFIAGSYAHVVNPHFDALGEFSEGYNDDCGPVAEAVCFASHWQIAPDPNWVAEYRNRQIAAGIFHSHQGITVDNLYKDMTNALSLPCEIVGYNQPLIDYHDKIHNALLDNNPVIVNLANATALKNNEPHVAYHFIVLGGIDTDLGFYVANGDQSDGKGGVLLSRFVPTYWTSWDNIAAAAPIALIICKRQA